MCLYTITILLAFLLDRIVYIALIINEFEYINIYIHMYIYACTTQQIVSRNYSRINVII